MITNIKRILIANRGEIARRIMRSAHAVGIECVAVYSDADSTALYVKEADAAVYIGTSPSVNSYLNIAKILDVALSCSVDAIHPGYGFLAENHNFARAVTEAGIGFIGPSYRTIEMMASKIKAKEIAETSGVNLVPGYIGLIRDEKEAKEIAEGIGFPVILKAVSGGGGKGMRIVHSAKEMSLAFKDASKEAEKSVGDGDLFLEKYITSPRHIEIQVIADKHGNTVCLGERECSIQRKNQKVIEEAPSSFINEKTGKLMSEQSINLFKKVNYHSAGTVEFVVDQQQNFYFLEVNTRLQVEHPVTEAITGIDIVLEMIRIEENHPLSFSQADVECKGWAFESRIYAEDPEKGFLPSCGRISHYKEPEGDVRVDSGVSAGDEITAFYDPMIAKISTHGKNRNEAIEKMRDALSSFRIDGVKNNVDFLSSIFHHKEFVNGNTKTNFIEKYYGNKFIYENPNSKSLYMFSSAALYVHLKEMYDNNEQSSINESFNVVCDDSEMTFLCTFEDEELKAFHPESKKSFFVFENQAQTGEGFISLIINNSKMNFTLFKNLLYYKLISRGILFSSSIYRTDVAHLRHFVKVNDFQKKKQGDDLLSPIAGVVTSVNVSKGEKVAEGKHIFTIEAMKMENSIYFDRVDAIVENVYVNTGSNVKSGDILMKLKKT